MQADSLDTALADFLEAFENLEWERFRRWFADDASVYFPFDTEPDLAQGAAAIEAVFSAFFSELRAKGSGPPYLRLVPRDRHIRRFDDIALVSFRLDLPGAVGRRTVVLRRHEGQWRIIHLHASNIGAVQLFEKAQA